jgi:ankyrin repeat protein
MSEDFTNQMITNVLILQSRILDLTADEIGDAIAFVSETELVTTAFGIGRVVATILLAVRMRPLAIPVLVQFIRALLQAATADNSLAMVKSCAVEQARRCLGAPDPFPKEAGLLSFLFHGFQYGFLTIDDIASLARSLLNDPFAGQSITWLLSYFAPELEGVDSNLMEALISRMNAFAANGQWPDALKLFAERINDLRCNNWALLKHDREACLVSPCLLSWIRDDDVQSLRDYLTHPEVTANDRFRPGCYVPVSALLASPTLIQVAAFLGAPSCFRFLLASGARLNEMDKSFVTLTQMAIAGGNLEIVRICQQYRLDFTATLNAAVKYHRHELFDWLFELCSHDTLELDAIGEHSIHAACASNNLYALKQLVNHGGDLNGISGFGPFTPLGSTARYDSVEAAELLLSCSDIDVDRQSLHGFTAASIAIRYGSLAVVERLIAHGADGNMLGIAAQFHQTQMIRLLLTQNGVDPNRVARDGATPLHRAILARHQAGVLALIADSRVNVNAVMPVDLTPLRLAIHHNNTAIFDAMMSRPDIDLLYRDETTRSTYLHAARRNPYMLRALLKKRVIDVNARDAMEMTVLHKAASLGDVEVAEILLAHPGVDVNAQDNIGLSALHRALDHGNAAFAEKLIECPRTNINVRSHKGNAPIYFAITRDLPGCVRALCRRADLDLRQVDGLKTAWSALAIAAFHRRVEVIQMLLEYPGMKMKQEAYGANHAIKVAKSKGFDDCLQVLEAGAPKKERPKKGLLAKFRKRNRTSTL